MTKYEHTAGVMGPFVKEADVQAMLNKILPILQLEEYEAVKEIIKSEGFAVKGND